MIGAIESNNDEGMDLVEEGDDCIGAVRGGSLV
jgi:hypothetical protein